MNKQEFAERVVLPPHIVVAPYVQVVETGRVDRETGHPTQVRTVVGYDHRGDYLAGYMQGLATDSHEAEQLIIRLALDGGMDNTPSNLLLGYIHGKHRRETGEDCRAAMPPPEIRYPHQQRAVGLSDGEPLLIECPHGFGKRQSGSLLNEILAEALGALVSHG